MKIFTVSFFGHRQIDNLFRLEDKLENVIHELLVAQEYVEFLVGRSGDFDQLAASVIRKCKKIVRSDNSALTLILPYMTAEYRNNEESFQRYYDEIEICKESAGKHFKSAYKIRNQSMVERSDMVIFYVARDSGGAFKTMEYAEHIHVQYINLAEEIEETR